MKRTFSFLLVFLFVLAVSSVFFADENNRPPGQESVDSLQSAVGSLHPASSQCDYAVTFGSESMCVWVYECMTTVPEVGNESFTAFSFANADQGKEILKNPMSIHMAAGVLAIDDLQLKKNYSFVLQDHEPQLYRSDQSRLYNYQNIEMTLTETKKNILYPLRV